MDMFLTKLELITLTGRALKGSQTEQLRKMGISFFVNASGRPVVTRAAIVGSNNRAEAPKSWSPKALSTRG